MTTRARFVLEDARAALSFHSEASSGSRFRVSWLAVVTALRAVGHVLVKVDAPTDPVLRQAVTQCWQELASTKPEPAIYWSFIEAERNRFLKNYEHGITRVQVVRSGSPANVWGLDLANAGKGTQLVTLYNVRPELPDRSVVSVIADGPFAGQPEAQVAAEAIEWWAAYLARIEALWGKRT
jgi:hypothetical protein